MDDKRLQKIAILILVILLAISVGVFTYIYKKNQKPVSTINSFEECVAAGYPILETFPEQCKADGKTFINNSSGNQDNNGNNPNSPQTQNQIGEPIANSFSRITKKPFGIYVTPASSPVNPERFTGFHTGTDFEITDSEVDSAVKIQAICSGIIRQVGTAQGYGGLVIQDCTINNQAVTVLYGHVDLTSKTLEAGTNLEQSEFIANLAAANSAMSGGERKHLHLGIHKGMGIDTRGYVTNQNELTNWIDYKGLSS